MRKTILLTVVLLTLTIATRAQQDYDYGKPEELKGLTKFFLDVENDLDAYNRIREEIEKSGLKISLVRNVDEAEGVLAFMSDSVTTFYNGNSLQKAVGIGIVARMAVGASKPRMLMQFRETQNWKLENHPATKFAREFIKAYKKANGLK